MRAVTLPGGGLAPVLWEARTGSHLWQMERPDSDIDATVIYAIPTRHLLAGRYGPVTMPQQVCEFAGDTYDTQFIEVGHLISLLSRGNFTALIAAVAPAVWDMRHHDRHRHLRHIIGSNPSKAIIPSVRGMAQGYMKSAEKAIAESDHAMRAHKLQGAARVLQFGAHYLTTGEINFDPVPFHIVSPEQVDPFFETFEQACSESEHPDLPPVKALEDWLYQMRLFEGGLAEADGWGENFG